MDDKSQFKWKWPKSYKFVMLHMYKVFEFESWKYLSLKL